MNSTPQSGFEDEKLTGEKRNFIFSVFQDSNIPAGYRRVSTRYYIARLSDCGVSALGDYQWVLTALKIR